MTSASVAKYKSTSTEELIECTHTSSYAKPLAFGIAREG
jgi:hypothetical protein